MNWDLVVIFTFVITAMIVRSKFPRQGSGPLGLAAPDQSALDRAMDVARRLEQRIDTLERLLDADAPGWRARVRA